MADHLLPRPAIIDADTCKLMLSTSHLAYQAAYQLRAGYQLRAPFQDNPCPFMHLKTMICNMHSRLPMCGEIFRSHIMEGRTPCCKRRPQRQNPCLIATMPLQLCLGPSQLFACKFSEAVYVCPAAVRPSQSGVEHLFISLKLEEPQNRVFTSLLVHCDLHMTMSCFIVHMRSSADLIFVSLLRFCC
jgi:hypothetical protein